MQAFACVASQCIAAACLHYAFIALGAMSHTAGVATPHQQPQQADAGPGRYNQKSTTLRNGTAETNWFYPTPAALKAAADVRGTRAARESCCLRSIRRPRAQATPRPTTRTSSSIPITRTAWCTASRAHVSLGFNLCLRSPRAARALVRGLRLFTSPGRGFGALALGIALAACNTLEYRPQRQEQGKRELLELVSVVACNFRYSRNVADE